MLSLYDQRWPVLALPPLPTVVSQAPVLAGPLIVAVEEVASPAGPVRIVNTSVAQEPAATPITVIDMEDGLLSEVPVDVIGATVVFTPPSVKASTAKLLGLLGKLTTKLSATPVGGL